jgi:hypothetical protein
MAAYHLVSTPDAGRKGRRTKDKHGDFGVNSPDGVEYGSELRVRAPNWHVPCYHATLSAQNFREAQERVTHKYVGGSAIASRNQDSLTIALGEITVILLSYQLERHSALLCSLRSMCLD